MQDTQTALDETEERGPLEDGAGGHFGRIKNTTRKPVRDRMMSVHPSVNPSLKYVGFSLLMAYHYIMWFSPESFFQTDLLAGSVTIAWLCNLVATALTLIVVACVLGRKRHLSDRPLLSRVIVVLLVVVTALLLYGAPLTRQLLVIDIFSFIAGALEGLMWVLWGESLTRARANFSVVHIDDLRGDRARRDDREPLPSCFLGTALRGVPGRALRRIPLRAYEDPGILSGPLA